MTERLSERDGNMNKKELIERIEGLKNIFGNECEYVKIDFVIELASELDELEAGRADEAPRYVKNILARLRELPLHDREVWLKTIMGEFEQDFSRAKWREGYEQGKVEGLIEREKVTVPQFVADWIERERKSGGDLEDLFDDIVCEQKHLEWFREEENMNLVARAWLDGYEVEKEKRYYVRFKWIEESYSYLTLIKHLNAWTLYSITLDKKFRTEHTKKQLEEAGFGWVFDCPGVEIEEVE